MLAVAQPMEEPAQPESRAARRRDPSPTHVLSAKDLSLSLLLVRSCTVVALAGLLVLTAWAHPWALAAAVAWACAGLAWGWGEVLDIRPARRLQGVILVAGVLTALAVAVVDGDERLRLVPVALAASVILTFLLQLLRRDGRPGLTDEVVATAGALAFVGMGAGLLPLATLSEQRAVLTVAMAGVGVSLFADAVSSRLGPSVWALVVTFGLGALLGGFAGGALGLALWWHGAAIGAASALLSYAVRRLLEVRPGSVCLSGQIASACASVLAVGALAQPLARIIGI